MFGAFFMRKNLSTLSGHINSFMETFGFEAKTSRYPHFVDLRRLAGELSPLVSGVGTAFGLPEGYLSENLSAFSRGSVAEKAGAIPLQTTLSPINFPAVSPQAKTVIPPTTPTAPPSQQSWAQQYLADSNSGKVTWDDNLRSYASSLLRGSSGTLESAAPDLSGQINAVYNPAFETLGKQQSYLQDVLAPAQRAELEAQKQNLLDVVAQKQRQTQEDISTREQNLQQSRQSALEQAIRARQGLAQQALARFGTSSSTGAVLGELASQEFARQQGQTEQNYAQAFQGLLTQRGRLDDWGNQETLRINRDVDSQLKSLEAELQGRILAIDQQKGALESQKAQAKVAELTKTLDEARALENARKTALINIDTFKQQMALTLAANAQGLNNDLFNVEANPFSVQQQSLSMGATPSQNIAYISNPRRYDEFGNLLNV